MKDAVSSKASVTPILFPFEPEQFWQSIRQIIREEIRGVETKAAALPIYQTAGMDYKPLYKIDEICGMLHITKPTIYEWIKHGKLKPYKIRSRVYFLWKDIQELIHPEING